MSNVDDQQFFPKGYFGCSSCDTLRAKLGEAEARAHFADQQAELLLELRAEVERLTQMVAPRYSIPIEEALGPLKPCPFCGSRNIGSHEGDVYCNRCDATNSSLSWQFRPPNRVAELEAEVEQLKDKNYSLSVELDEVETENVEISSEVERLKGEARERTRLMAYTENMRLIKEVIRLRNALEKYGSHQSPCLVGHYLEPVYEDGRRTTCVCGFTEALAGGEGEG